MLTVTTPAETYDLTSVEDVKAQLGISGTADDENIARWIRQASDVISVFCNRVFAQETVAETFRHLSRQDGLLLSRFPASAIISVLENGALLTAPDYELDESAGILNRLRGDGECEWPRGKVVVTYTAGYALPDDLPSGVSRAAIMLVGHYRSMNDRAPFLRSEDIPGVMSLSYQDTPESFDLPPEIRAHLTALRVPASGG